MTRVVVTQEDIDRGLRADCTSCPVALAVSRATGCAVTVGMTTIYLEPGGLFDIPADVGRIIARFDEQALMEPFEFCIPYEPAK